MGRGERRRNDTYSDVSRSFSRVACCSVNTLELSDTRAIAAWGEPSLPVMVPKGCGWRTSLTDTGLGTAGSETDRPNPVSRKEETELRIDRDLPRWWPRDPRDCVEPPRILDGGPLVFAWSGAVRRDRGRRTRARCSGRGCEGVKAERPVVPSEEGAQRRRREAAARNARAGWSSLRGSMATGYPHSLSLCGPREDR